MIKQISYSVLVIVFTIIVISCAKKEHKQLIQTYDPTQQGNPFQQNGGYYNYKLDKVNTPQNAIGGKK